MTPNTLAAIPSSLNEARSTANLDARLGDFLSQQYPPGDCVDGPVRAPVEAAVVAPITIWDKSIAVLRENGDLTSRVAKIAETLGAPKEDRPALLAWWLVEHHLRSNAAPVVAYLVVGNLLKEAGQMDEAVRILSEVVPIDPNLAAIELRRWSQLEDLKRLEGLTSRGDR